MFLKIRAIIEPASLKAWIGHGFAMATDESDNVKELIGNALRSTNKSDKELIGHPSTNRSDKELIGRPSTNKSDKELIGNAQRHTQYDLMGVR